MKNSVIQQARHIESTILTKTKNNIVMKESIQIIQKKKIIEILCQQHKYK